MQRKSRESSGFSFVEIAVVISIMGLIVAGVLVGQQLTDAARLKSMITEMQTLKTATGQFQSIYNGLPGDIADATDYWSGSTDGNSNGRVEAETSNEAFVALDQLSLAGYIDGDFSGAWGSAFTRDGNVMASSMERGAMMYLQCCGGDDADSSLEFINQVVVFSGANNNTERAGVFTPIEAQSIDSKMDDGSPDMGEVGAIGNEDSGSYTKAGCFENSGAAASYLVDEEDTNCQMFFGYNWE